MTKWPWKSALVRIATFTAWLVLSDQGRDDDNSPPIIRALEDASKPPSIESGERADEEVRTNAQKESTLLVGL